MSERELLEAKNILYKVDRLNLMIIRSRIPVYKTTKLCIYLIVTEQGDKETMEKMSKELKPGVSKKRVIEESSSREEEVEEIDPSFITDKLLQKYASEMPSKLLMTISEELFYSDAMVQREYDRLNEEDKKKFDQMKVLAEKIKKETGQYVPIEDMMARVVAQRFGRMTQQNIATVLGPSGEGPAAGKVLEKKVDILRIKAEEGSEEERKVVLIAIVPNEDPACLAYCVEEDEDVPKCVSIASKDSDIAVQKPEVQAILKELASIKRKEADCYEQLMVAIPDMTDEEITEVGERVWPSRIPKCAHQLYDQLKNPRNFRTVLAVGERMFSLYKHEQAGEPIAEVPELCERYDISKTKLYEVLRGGKYKKEMSTPKPKSVKPARRVATIKLGEMEERPRGKGHGKKSS